MTTTIQFTETVHRTIDVQLPAFRVDRKSNTFYFVKTASEVYRVSPSKDYPEISTTFFSLAYGSNTADCEDHDFYNAYCDAYALLHQRLNIEQLYLQSEKDALNRDIADDLRQDEKRELLEVLKEIEQNY